MKELIIEAITTLENGKQWCTEIDLSILLKEEYNLINEKVLDAIFERIHRDLTTDFKIEFKELKTISFNIKFGGGKK